MRRWNKLSVIVAFLSAIMIVSVVFNSGAIDVLTSPLASPSAPAGAPESSSPEVFVDPYQIVKDWVYDPGYQTNGTFEVHVNITGVANLTAWQLNMSWNPSILNVSNVIAGEFLNRANPAANTTSHELGYVINMTDNATGYTAIAESILGGYQDVNGSYIGVNGSGRLVTIEFQVVGYGYTNLSIITAGGTLPTTLLNSTHMMTPEKDSMTFTTVNGWFDNRVTGDSDGNGFVTIADMGEVSDRWTSPAGIKPYARFVDWDPVGGNGFITIADMGIVSDNWGRFKVP